MSTLAKHFMSTLPENLNYESIAFGAFMVSLQNAYVDMNYPTDTIPTMVFYPGNHICIELLDGSALAFAATHDLFIPGCKVYWIKDFASLIDAKNYVAPLAGASHNDNVREFFTKTRH